MKPETPGTTELTREQRDWYHRKFGLWYHRVPDRTPTFIDEHGKLQVRANRVQRRAQARARG